MGGLLASTVTASQVASDSNALAEDGILFGDYRAGSLGLAEIVDTTLRMSKLRLIDIYERSARGVVGLRPASLRDVNQAPRMTRAVPMIAAG